MLKKVVQIYVSHHPALNPKAQELVKHLQQLSQTFELRIDALCLFLPGTSIKQNIRECIKSSDIILSIPSVDYLIECQEEMEWIEKSKCFKSNAIIPIICEQCLWKDTFLGNFTYLPKDSQFQKSPFDDSGLWYEVTLGVKSFLSGTPKIFSRSLPIVLARADGFNSEHSQEWQDLEDSCFSVPVNGEERLFKIEGDSMAPNYQDNDILIAKPIDLKEFKIKPQHVFVLRTRSNETVVKRIGQILDSKIELISDNPLHPILKIDTHDLMDVFLVTADVKHRRYDIS